jgi:hypothetical protein
MAKGEFTIGKGCVAVFLGILAVIVFFAVGPILGLLGLVCCQSAIYAEATKNVRRHFSGH